MIKKLKRKFIILATVSIFVLMTVLVGVMGIVNYSSVVSDSDNVLNVISRSVELRNSKNPPGEFFEKIDGFPRRMSPEVLYESRYFTALVSQSGEIVKADFSKIISVDRNSVQEYVDKAVSKKGTRGFIGQFRFFKTNDNGLTQIIFLDCGRRLDAFYTFMLTSMAVGLSGCLIVFVIFLFAAGKIVRPIAESYEKQKRFITDAGHEIKTPLTIINANLDLMEDDFSENESLFEIREQTKRLTELTGDLVYLSKMEESENTMQKVEFPVSDLVSETAATFQAIATAQKKEYLIQVEPSLTMNGAPDAIRQLVSVLLENAMKYSPEDGVVKLDLVSDKKKTISLCVFNTTKEKISQENLQHLFERFYRTDSSRNSETGGHGIGLSIAKAITTAHGGKISAETKNGFDFKITVTLPI